MGGCEMTSVRERLLNSLRWQATDKVALTCYDWMLPRGSAERALREAGLGIVHRLPAHRSRQREVEIRTREYWEGGRRLVRRSIHTPVGEVWQTLEAEGEYNTSNWIKEHFIKGPEDYRVMEFYLRDAEVSDNFAEIVEARRRMGDDGIVIVRVAKSPIQEMLYQMLGYEQFAIDFHHNREAFDSLHAVMQECYAKWFALAAESPAEIVLLGDNITSDVVGRERFRQYLQPGYASLRKQLNAAGKLLAVHMDGRLRSLASEIGEAEIDIIEALTPPPMGDFSVAEARQQWPGKALWINYTSSTLLESEEAVAAHTRELLRQAGDSRGFAISITEDAPVADLLRSLAVILRVLDEGV